MGGKPRKKFRYNLTVEMNEEQYHALRFIARKRGKTLEEYVFESVKTNIHSDCNHITYVERLYRRKKTLTYAQKKKLIILAKGAKIYPFSEQFRIAGQHIDPRTVRVLEDCGYIAWDSKKDLWEITDEGKEAING